MFQRISRVRQHDASDCGAACLHAVAEHHGLRVSLARLRQFASTDRHGTTLLGLAEAAERLGFTARGVRASADALPAVPLPAVAHVAMEDGRQHYVVVHAVRRGRVTVMDPADGAVHRWPAEAFAARWTGALLLLAPARGLARESGEGSLPRRFWTLVRPHRGVLLQSLLGAAFYTLLGLSTSIYVQKLVDHVLVDGNRNLLNLMGVLMLGLLLAQLYVGTLKSLFVLRTSQKLDGALILGYYKHLLGLPQRFFDTMRVGEIISRVGDAVKIRAFINEAAVDLVVSALVLLFSFTLMAVYSARLALLMLGLLPLYAAIFYLTNRVNRRRQRRVMERGADLQAQLVESLNAVATIKRFGLEAHANLNTETRFVRLLREVYGAAVAGLASSAAVDLSSRLFTLLLLWVGAGLVLDRALTPGQLMSCYALAGFLTGPAARLIGVNRTLQDAVIAADRLFEIMDLEREQGGAKVTLTPAMVGDLRFRDVHFRYGTRREVFSGLDLTIPRGRLTAVVGESGSGKSTLAALLQDLYPVESGRVSIGEVDVAQVSHESLRRLVAAVPQKVDLFAGTLLENIAVGDFEPSLERVLALGRLLGLAEFVDALPAGYDSEIGENGSTLSGGQRQRVAIARALYGDPEIVLLDEATSSLDSVSERHVHHAVQSLRARGKTIVMIAHRLSSVVGADRIVVLEGGRAVEEGTHAELLARGGAYHRLWQHQFPAAWSGVVPSGPVLAAAS